MNAGYARVAKLADARDLKCSPATFTLYSPLLRCCNFSTFQPTSVTPYQPGLRGNGHSLGIIQSESSPIKLVCLTCGKSEIVIAERSPDCLGYQISVRRHELRKVEILENDRHGGSGCRKNIRHFGLRDIDEATDDFGIELRPAVRDQTADGFFHRKTLSIRAIRDHGIESIDDRNDSGTNGRIAASQAARIAGAVEIFVVVQREQAGTLKTGNDPLDGPSVFRMLVDDLALFCGKFARFVQDRIRHADLADVVEDCGRFHISKN
jgi:hypothetical protein